MSNDLFILFVTNGQAQLRYFAQGASIVLRLSSKL